ncbi:MAG: hypothetical protein H7839_00810 [Magnetococcus sp. YQC-5]
MSRFDKLLSLLNRPCFATFGTLVVYTPSLENRMELGGMPITLVGIFDEKREVVSMDASAGMDAVIPRPVVEIKLSDLILTGEVIAPMAGDDVTIAGLLYRILDVQLDGKGLAVLILNRMQDPFAF